MTRATRIHWLRWEWRSLCGRYLDPEDFATANPEAVTCATCRRSTDFGAALLAATR